MDIFGPQFNQTEIMSGITSTNTNYGGLRIAGSKVNVYVYNYNKMLITS